VDIVAAGVANLRQGIVFRQEGNPAVAPPADPAPVGRGDPVEGDLNLETGSEISGFAARSSLRAIASGAKRSISSFTLFKSLA
jgi:hypothetical protein